jgi:S1-C subfamily serine protease
MLKRSSIGIDNITHWTAMSLVWAAAFGLIGMALVVTADAGSDPRNALVKIYGVQNKPDYDNPWNMKGPESTSGSGCIISGQRILTNAHVVSDQTYLQVRRHGQSRKYVARMLAVSHESDLALLTVDDAAFFDGATPIALGDLPEIQQTVTVLGFPKGGDTLSTTRGVISRIEHQRYAHSLISLLAVQIDAAINPGNSGGPVLLNNHLAGVVMQLLSKSENIGYMVPTPVIKHFLKDLEDGAYDGFPLLGLAQQSMENQGLRKKYRLAPGDTGVLVTAVLPSSSARGVIQVGDVILALDGQEVADDGTVEFRPRERTAMSYIVQQKQIGERLDLEVLRDGQPRRLTIRLTHAWGSHRLVPFFRYDRMPAYYIYGGLVFCPLTLNYLLTWGYDWEEDAPSNLLNYLFYERPRQEREQVVLISKILPAEVNNGYEDVKDRRIISVNDQSFRNLEELIAIIESGQTPFVALIDQKGREIVIDRHEAKRSHQRILKAYQIANDRSAEFR